MGQSCVLVAQHETCLILLSMPSFTEHYLPSSKTSPCSKEAKWSSSKPTHVSCRPAQQPNIAQIYMRLKKVISPRQAKAAYMLVLEKDPSSFLFIKGDWSSQKVRKKKRPCISRKMQYNVLGTKHQDGVLQLQTQSRCFFRPERKEQLHSP